MPSTIVAYERLHRKLRWTSIISDQFRQEILEAIHDSYVEGVEDGQREVRDKEDINKRIARKQKAWKEARGES